MATSTGGGATPSPPPIPDQASAPTDHGAPPTNEPSTPARRPSTPTDQGKDTPDQASPPTDPKPFRLDADARRVFIGLMLGMLVASISQTIVGPALPRIVAELGGMDHYSWVATAAMLVSAVTVPIVGKLSDLYGRRGFYLGGLAVFIFGSLICGLSTSFWMLVAGRAVQGFGMGTLMPLSQTIIGDIIPARQRGKYQGLLGAVFGVTSVAGPLAGGFITDHWGWRWLFFVSIPVGLIASAFIVRFLHLSQERRKAPIDYLGIITLSTALTTILLATSWGGTTFPWNSPTIATLYGVGAVMLVAFVFAERRAAEPVIPLHLFRNSIFTLANLASFGLAMVMFGCIIYIPVYAQGVIGVNATESGLILMPLMLGLILLGIGSGLFITRTGRYKGVMISGVVIMAVGVWLLTRLTYTSTSTELTIAMVVLGTGLGMCLQHYTLVVQNATARRDLGVATASSQFFRNVGSTVGIAVFGTVMTSGLREAIVGHLPPGAASRMSTGGGLDAGAVLDPAKLSALPPAVAGAVRHGLADRLHEVFLIALPILALVLLATMVLRVIPLRETVHSHDEARQELLDSLGQSAHSPDEIVPMFGSASGHARTRERILGLRLQLLARNALRPDRPLLSRAVADLGGGDLRRGVDLLERTALMLASDDYAVAADAERFAAEVAAHARRQGGILSPDLRKDLAVAASASRQRTVLHSVEPSVVERHEAVELPLLETAGNDLGAALLVDLENTRAGEPPRGHAERPREQRT